MKKLMLLFICLPSFSFAQIITTIAGNSSPAYTGDGGPATASQLDRPTGVVVDTSGNIYIGDYSNNAIRKINAAGIISTIAGTGVAGYSGDGGPATAALLDGPTQLFIDAFGNIYIADALNNVIREINTAGIISTVAGNGAAGYAGDGGPATAANLDFPNGVITDAAGNIYITDYSNNVVRKVNTSGIITTIAGNGTMGSGGDGGPATSAQLNLPSDLCADPSGNLYVSDANNSRVRKIDITGTMTTFAGTGAPGFSGDYGPASAAQLYNNYGIVMDVAGNIYIGDQNNNRIRKIDASGIITTVAGVGSPGYSGDGEAATLAQLNIPSGLCVDQYGNIYIADQHNHRVREVYNCINSITTEPIGDTVVSGASATFTVVSSIASSTYQWQENPGTGFVNLADVWPYSGVTTNVLTIHNASIYLDTTYYRCVIFNVCNDTSSSAILVIDSINSDEGVKTLTQESINIFPNPAHDNVVIRLPGNVNNGNIGLLNELGQVVSAKKISGSSVNFDLANLPASIYMLKITVNGQVIYKKIIKN